MAVFGYHATDLDGAAISGTVTADTPRQARDLLRARGLTLRSVTAVARQRAECSGLFNFRARFGSAQAAWTTAFIRELSTLLTVGIPLLDALDTLVRQQRGRHRLVLLSLREQVAAGVSLADAMRELPVVFEPLTVAMVQVGEHAGKLDDVLNQLASFKDRSLALRSKVRAALLYPGIVLIVGLGVSLFLMSFVVPKLLESLVEAGRPLPWATQVVKAISDALIGYWLPMGLGAAAIFGMAGLWQGSSGGRRLRHRMLLNLPVLGELFRKQVTARVAMVIATLMRSGMAFERALEVARACVNNFVVKDALLSCENAVRAGKDIAVALESTGVFQPSVVQVFAVGQQAGRLEDMLDRLAEDFDKQAAAGALQLTTMLEPILILLLASLVGFVAFATVMPMLEAGKVL